MRRLKNWSWIFFGSALLFAQENGLKELTVEKIMRDPKWIGNFPSEVSWSEDGQWVYFLWNPENAAADSLYAVSRNGGKPRKVSFQERQALPEYGSYDREHTRKVYSKDGDLFLLHLKSGRKETLTRTNQHESSPQFTRDGLKITFESESNLFLMDLKKAEIVQVTNFQTEGQRARPEAPPSENDLYRQRRQLSLSEALKRRKHERELEAQAREGGRVPRPKEIVLSGKWPQGMELSPDGRYVTYALFQQARDSKRTLIPNYVTESGFTETNNAYPKVGSSWGSSEFFIFDTVKDSVYSISFDLPGMEDEPEYLKEYMKESGKPEDEKPKKKKMREVSVSEPVWSGDGKHAVIHVIAQDHKDRWIALFDPATGKATCLDRQHDEAWIDGPGIGGWRGGDMGWMPDNRRIWFQSEETGYSHLYTLDATTQEKKALTQGTFEVYSPEISKDKKAWFFMSNEVHPGERHLYRMALEGGPRVRITSEEGHHDAMISPDGRMSAVLFSTSTRPWELYLTENKPGGRKIAVTRSVSDEFLSYPWRKAEVITFQAQDGAAVPARIYRPGQDKANGKGVIFVHGAGYLQNAHKWWSEYFREYMFHNLLADKGYTVLDIDYRGSAGYGRDWRTAIYRHMGGKDLDDHVDGAKTLVEKCGVDPKRIGIYGGSYGGFITFMALFLHPDVFAAGAALRPVSDFAHYNHYYTSPILNTPATDSLAYYRSSPINFAEGLKGHLLICHGMIDDNVHFQDSVRLVQRLIELGKENWELAVYPLERHTFQEPSSWTDEYKRILKLFEEHL